MLHRRPVSWMPWWRHQMETFSTLLALCAGNSPVTGKFPSQRPVTRSYDVFFDLHPNKRLSKQSGRWWFETPTGSLWRHCNGYIQLTAARQFFQLVCGCPHKLTAGELDPSGSFYYHGLTLIPSWICNYIHYDVWDEITYPFPNFNGATIVVWEWMNNFIPHFTRHAISYPFWN